MKTKSLFHRLMIAALIALGASQAFAAVDFQDVPAVSAGGSADVVSGGYVFKYSNTFPLAVHGVTNLDTFGAAGNHYLAYEAGVGTETFSRQDGGLFNLLSLDIGGWENFGSNSATLTITGLKADFSTLSFSAAVLPDAFSTFQLTGFTHLRSVTLGALPGRGYLAVDNLQVTAVPESETYALMLAGLGLMAAVSRRRKAV
ncbi:PEP-CTERM protein-sorting domain [Comamonadaceae bacterium]